MPRPNGGIHLAVSRPRLGQINDSARNKKFARAFKKTFRSFVKEHHRLPNCLCLSELSMLPIMAAAELNSCEKLGAKKVKRAAKIFVVERNVQMRSVLQSFADQNVDRVQSRIVFLENCVLADLDPDKIPEKVSELFMPVS